MERAKRPLNLTGGKLFILSNETFTSVRETIFKYKMKMNVQTRFISSLNFLKIQKNVLYKVFFKSFFKVTSIFKYN